MSIVNDILSRAEELHHLNTHLCLGVTRERRDGLAGVHQFGLGAS